MKHLLAGIALLSALASAQTYEHVIITAESFVPSFAPLGRYVEDELGLGDTTVTVEHVYANYPGRDNAERVRNFIRDAYDNWGMTHVLLGGDTDVVPYRLAYVYRYGRTQNIPCDLYFADLDGDWDGDGDNVFGELEDSVDLYPDVSIGRASVSSPQLAERFVSKVLTYASDSTAPYLDEALLSGFDLYDEPVIRGEYHCEIVDTTCLPSVMRPCRKVYNSQSGNHKTDILAALNAGTHIWVHADHASWWSVGAGYLRHGATINVNEVAALANGTDYTIGFINGCHAGAFDSSDCVVEAFLSAPNGGGVAAFANARPGLTIDPDWHRAGSYLQAQLLVDRLLNQGHSTRLGDFAGLQALMAPLADTSPTYRWCQYQYNLFGEPLMPVWVRQSTAVGEPTAPGAARPMPYAGPSVVRGVLFLGAGHDWFPLGETGSCPKPALLDAVGRGVLDLHPGPNDVPGCRPACTSCANRRKDGAPGPRLSVGPLSSGSRGQK